MKNKPLIVTNIILLICIIIALISVMIFGIMGKFNNYSNSKLIYEKTYALADINEVKMNLKNYDIEIVEEYTDNVKLKVYSNKNKQNIVADLKGNILDLRQTGSTFCFGFCYYSQKVVLSIPKNNNIILNLYSTSGDITSSFLLQKNVVMKTTSGDIILDEIYDGKIKTTSGDISIVGAKDLEAYTTSGDINISSVRDGDIATTSGDISINYLEQGVVSSVSGEIDIINYAGSGKVSTTSGDIEIKALEILDNVKIKSVSGDVDIRLKNEAIINTSTKSGDVDVKASRGEFELQIETTSGDITVK